MSDALSMRTIEVGDLPFTAPLEAVDEVRVATAERHFVVQATKRVDPGDPYMEGHFPSLTIYPGVFIVETLRQAVALALGRPAEITGMSSVRFLAPLFAGDVLRLEATARAGPGGIVEVDARCRRSDGRLAARLKIEVDRG